MKILAALLALVVGATLSACEEGRRAAAPPSPAPTPSPAEPSRSSTRGERAPSIPRRPKVHLGALGAYEEEVKRALSDLRQIGMWRELTSHLYRIDVMVRPGRASVPPDRHLADARFWRATVAHGTYGYPVGRFCWIRFFPAAMADDLARWASYYERGVTDRPPPSQRRFWAAILGHELSHCPKKGSETTPEHEALAWESRILEALAAAGIE